MELARGVTGVCWKLRLWMVSVCVCVWEGWWCSVEISDPLHLVERLYNTAEHH